jgi:hypothetical protein
MSKANLWTSTYEASKEMYDKLDAGLDEVTMTNPNDGVKRFALLGAKGCQEMAEPSESSRECGFPEYIFAPDHDAAMTLKDKKIRFLKMVRDDQQKTITQFGKDNDTLSDALVVARAEVAKLRGLLAELVECNDGPCHLDHHGYCQTHFLESDCVIKRAREALAQKEGK